MRKMTEATAIPKAVKEAVFLRDGGRCVFCGSLQGAPVAHIVRRSQGGLGVETNIITLCPACHRALDEGEKRAELEECVDGYMKRKYPDWCRENQIYKKWRN